jgi:glutamyl-tRNA reductase
MSVLVVGVSHKSAPVAVLERLALDPAAVVKLVHEVLEADHVLEATALATCNRVEIYADVERFHGSVETLSRLLCERAGEPTEDLVPYLYVHYDDGAVSHLFHVVTGLDSMVLGEGQILAQTRDALRMGQDNGSIGPALNALFQQALRVGKRVHAETDIDGAAPSLVSVALQRAAEHVGAVHGKRVVVMGAGSMAALAVATVSRLGAVDVAIANRTSASAARLAAQYGGRAVALDDADREIAAADVLISCTGATGVVLPVARVVSARATATDPLAVIDLALPHDVDPAVGDLPGVQLIGLATLAGAGAGAGAGDRDGDGAGDSAGVARAGEDAVTHVRAVRDIVTEELSAFFAARRSANVTPTVVALRSMATEVVEAEMARLHARLPDLDPQVAAEVEATVRRVTDKLLHHPTVRIKELANETGAVSYAEALATLFSLGPETAEALRRGEVLP